MSFPQNVHLWHKTISRHPDYYVDSPLAGLDDRIMVKELTFNTSRTGQMDGHPILRNCYLEVPEEKAI
ncbi:MAG: hypothetical protein WAM88_07700 [Nitrososphaeraceae archaeon]